MSPRVRAAIERDLRQIVSLGMALWPDEPGPEIDEHMRATLAGLPRSTLPLTLFVVEDSNDRLIGFIEVGLRSHADGCDGRQPVGFIEGWYVVPEVRGRGVGRALANAAEEWARQRGCIEIASDTWADNEASQLAHRAVGFEMVDRCVNFRKALMSETPADSAVSVMKRVDTQ